MPVKKTTRKTTKVVEKAVKGPPKKKKAGKVVKKRQEVRTSPRERREEDLIGKVFTMEDAAEFLRKQRAKEQGQSPEKKTGKKIAKVPTKKRKHKAASISDILGRTIRKNSLSAPKARVPSKWKPYYEKLLQLRRHFSGEVELHTAESLRRNSYSRTEIPGKDDDTFDHEMAMNLISTEQECLYEIDQAIERIHKGNYGICEITGKPIKVARLKAIPFTRHSLMGQRSLEKQAAYKPRRSKNIISTQDIFNANEEHDEGQE